MVRIRGKHGHAGDFMSLSIIHERSGDEDKCIQALKKSSDLGCGKAIHELWMSYYKG